MSERDFGERRDFSPDLDLDFGGGETFTISTKPTAAIAGFVRQQQLPPSAQFILDRIQRKRAKAEETDNPVTCFGGPSNFTPRAESSQPTFPSVEWPEGTDPDEETALRIYREIAGTRQETQKRIDDQNSDAFVITADATQADFEGPDGGVVRFIFQEFDDGTPV